MGKPTTRYGWGFVAIPAAMAALASHAQAQSTCEFPRGLYRSRSSLVEMRFEDSSTFLPEPASILPS